VRAISAIRIYTHGSAGWDVVICDCAFYDLLCVRFDRTRGGECWHCFEKLGSIC
jgi:hypothetical protein